MTSLGFRKTDYKNLSTDPSAVDGENDGQESDDEDLQISFSEILDIHDDLWYIWQHLKMKAEEIAVPIFDKGNFPQFLNFITMDDPYLDSQQDF